jgi:hypothetical protein
MFSKGQIETRSWHRSVRQLGNRAREKALQQELEMRYPEALYQFNIGVCGASDTTEVKVSIWNRRINLMGFVKPENFGGDARAAILQMVKDLFEDFDRES